MPSFQSQKQFYNHKVKSKTGAAKDVEAILVIEKDPKDVNKLDIDYEMVVDPDAKHPMNVHTHAEVDKEKMDVTGVAEAEGAGTADVEGMIRKGGAKDHDDFTLDVTLISHWISHWISL